MLLWTVRLGVLLVLAMPLIVRSDVYFPFIVGKAVYARCVIEITFALWLVLVLFNPRYRPPRSWVIVALGLWLAASVIAGFMGVSLVRSVWSSYERMQGLFDQAHWFAFILVAGSVFRTLAGWKWVFSVNLGVSAVVALLGLGQHFDVLNSNLLGSEGRITSTLGNATYLGAYTMVSALVGVGMIVHSLGQQATDRVGSIGRRRSSRRRGRRRAARDPVRRNYVPWLRALWLLMISVNMWALWLTSTRGAVAGLAVGMAVFAIGYALRGSIPAARWAAYGILIVALAGPVLFVASRTTTVFDPVVESSTMLRRISSVGTGDMSMRGRIVSVVAGLRAYRDRPLFGWGPENYLIAWGRYFDAESGIRQRFDQAHSKVIEELTTKGALGLLTYMGVWLAAAAVVVRSLRRRREYDQLFIGIVGATLAAYFVQNLFLFDTPTTVMQLSLLIAFVVSEEMWARSHAQQAASDRRESPSGRPGFPRRWDHNLRLPEVSGLLRSWIGMGAVIALVAALTIFSLAQLNFKAYSGAAATLQATIPQSTWSDWLDAFDRAIAEFPALANYPRIVLVDRASAQMADMTDEDFEKTVELITTEGQRGLAAEPENWRLQANLGEFFQVAATRDPAYLKIARVHVDEAVELAPNTREVLEVSRRQELLEELLEP